MCLDIKNSPCLNADVPVLNYALNTSMNSSQNATVVLSDKERKIITAYPVSSSNSITAHTFVSSVTLSLDPASISSVIQSVFGTDAPSESFRLRVPEQQRRPFSVAVKSHSSSFPSAAFASYLYKYPEWLHFYSSLLLSLNLLIHTIFPPASIYSKSVIFLQYLLLLYHPLPLFSICFYTIWTRRRRLVTVRRQVNGIAPDTDTPFHQLLSCADEQMYLAKQRLKAKNKPSDK